MKQKKYYYLIFSLLLLSLKVNAQTIAETYTKAHQQYNELKFTEAAANFSRIAYFETAGNLKDSALLFEAKCYFNLKEYNEALSSYNTLYRTSRGMLKLAAFWEIINCQFAIKQFGNALTTLSLSNFKLDSVSQKKFIFYKSIAQLAYAYYEDAQQNLLLYINDTSDSRNDSIKYLINQLKDIQDSKTGGSSYFSIILPGSGQIINGHFWNGVNSLLLNAALISVTVNTSVAYTVYDALLSVAPWWIRYYRGGIRNTKLQAEEKKADKINKNIQEIITLITRDKTQTSE